MLEPRPIQPGIETLDCAALGIEELGLVDGPPLLTDTASWTSAGKV
ncbi:MAG: hypothetical protein ACREYF_29480 [Gammaproteobacteria bacterium]